MKYYDPWSTKEALRWFLGKLKERDELECFIEDYIIYILGHSIICRPSRGPYGEQGKDITACENEQTKCYCSYVIKCGDLRHNLNGKYGILKQLEDALFIELESRDYHDKPRTAIVVHNGFARSRGSQAKYEKHRESLEDELTAEGKLLRPVDRWDLDTLTERLFPHRAKFEEIERSRQIIELQRDIHDKAIEFLHKANIYMASNRKDAQESDALIRETYDRLMLSIQKYSPNLHRRSKDNA